MASRSGAIDRHRFQQMAESLRGRSGPPRLWFDSPEAASNCSFAVGGCAADLLPEDRFDRQPLISPDGQSVFACHARLDNRAELMERLEMRRTAAGIADSELLQAAYLRWGPECLRFLTGDFAFAVLSMRERSLFAAVDPLGNYRLFYAVAPGRLVMTTQLAAMRACPGLELTPAEAVLGRFAAGLMGEGETGFAEVRSLLGGHTLRWRDDAVELQRWWRPDATPRLRFNDPEEYVALAEDLFASAVRGCLRSSTPVSSTLSGGLDSGLVTAEAARQMRGGPELHAYTAAPNLANAALQRQGWDADDAPFAAATAALHPNVRQKILRTEERTALDLLPPLHLHSAVPVRNGANHVWLEGISHAMRERGSRVLLTGARGNFGLSFHGLGGFHELFWQGRWRAAFRVAAEMERAGERPVWKTVSGGLLPQRAFDWLRWRMYGRRSAEAGERDFLAASFRRGIRSDLQPHRPAERTRAAFARRAVVPMLVWAADSLPQWDIEMRDPLSDRRLLEALLSMPLHAFTVDGRARGLARRLGKGRLPDSVRLRRTQGQQAPDYAAVMGRRAGVYRDLIEAMSVSPACRRLFDMDALREGIDAVAAGGRALYLTSGLDRITGVGLFLLRGGRA